MVIGGGTRHYAPAYFRGIVDSESGIKSLSSCCKTEVVMKRKKFGIRRVLAALLSLLLIVTVVPMADGMEAKADGIGKIKFTLSVAEGGGTVQYKLGDGSWQNASDNLEIGTTSDASATSQTLSLKASVNEGFSFGNYKIVNKGADNSGSEALGGTDTGGLSGDNGQTFDITTSNNYEVQLEIRSNSGGGGGAATINVVINDTVGAITAGCGVKINNNPVSDGSTVNPTGNANFNVIGSSSYEASYTITSSDDSSSLPSGSGITDDRSGNFNVQSGATYTFTVTYSTASSGDPGSGTGVFGIRIEEGPGASGKYTLSVATSTDGSSFSGFSDVTAPYTAGGEVRALKFKISKSGSANIMLQDPEGAIDSVTHGLDVGREYTITVAKTYTVQVDMPWNTITWGGSESGTDFSSINGTVTLEKLTVDGVEENISSLTIASDSPALFDPDNGRYMAIKNGGDQSDLFISEAQTGTIVATFKFKPDYGYQVTDVTTNGGSKLSSFTPGTEISSFTLNCNSLNIHFGVIFSKVEDTVTVSDTSTVSSGAIGNGQNAVDSGNLAMSVAAGTATDDMTTLAKESDESAELVGAVGISLQQVVSKTGSNGNWTNNLTDLSGNIDVSLGLTDADASASYSVVRQHDTNLSYINATYSNGSITFPTDKFSTYAIYKTDKRADDIAPVPSSDDTETVSKVSSSSSAEEDATEETPDFTQILKSYDGAASGLNFDNSSNTSAGQTHKVSLSITSTGDAGVPATAKAVMPTGFRDAFGFNILVDGKPATGNKSGELIINIPKYYLRNNRVFGLLITDAAGKTQAYFDEDLNPLTFTADINTTGYVCELIYIDTALILKSASAISGGRAYVVGQGPLWQKSAGLVIPEGYKPLFTFNIARAAGRLTSAPGTIVLEIPAWALRTGRTYALIGVEDNGIPHLYRDSDTAAGTITATVGDTVTSYALIYRD